MSDTLTLSVEKRDRAGKGLARALRREGKTPAVIYGDKKAPTLLSLKSNELRQQIQKQGFFTKLIGLTFDGKTYQALAKDVQFHPVTDEPLHVDFLRVKKDATITIEVPVTFINEESSTGLKRGGVLNIVRHAIEVTCRADQIPEVFTIDLKGTNIGDSIHVSSVKLPDGVEPTVERDFTIATIVSPTVSQSEDTDEETETSEEESTEEDKE